MPNTLEQGTSLATSHRLLGDPDTTLPLWPPISQYATAAERHFNNSEPLR
jgi:hypothetical protein